VVDIPYGRILRIDAKQKVNVEVEWDGEPNGLAVDPDGKIAIADYKLTPERAF
jgi:sugar lactone lactonase YvrE